MVGSEEAQMSVKESFYEEIITKGQLSAKTDLNCNIELEDSDVYTSMCRKQVDSAVQTDSVSDGENIYDSIPGDCVSQNCEQCHIDRSFGCGAGYISKDSIRRKKEVQQDSQSEQQSNSSARLAPLESNSSPDLGSSTQYAEIIHLNKVSDFVPSRPTRESENPILRQDFSSSLSSFSNLRDLRKRLTEMSQERCLEQQRSARTTPFATPECPRKPGEKIVGQRLSKSLSPRNSPKQSPREKHPPGPIYVNMEFPLVENGDNNSRRTSASSSSSISFNERQSLSSTDDSVFKDTEVSPYENIRDTLDSGSLREESAPVDIVYSDLHFHETRPKPKLGKTCSISTGSCPGKIKVEERSRSLPGQQVPLRNNISRQPRPKSLSLGKLNKGALGFYIGARFVKSATVHRANSNTLQSTIHDIVSKTTLEDSVSVNVEVTMDLMRISTNCSPWDVITSFGIENIGWIDLYKQDTTVLGIIVCLPDVEAECHVIQCQDAQLIFSAVKNAFNSSTSKAFTIPVSTTLGPESWLGVPTFNGISYLGSLKIKKTYLLMNESISLLLEKAHPKEFKNIYLEVRPEEIRLIDAKDNKILHKHAIPWILLLGVYEQDTRFFGYVVSEARQGEKTKMFCHVFRCSRITMSVAATEAIRVVCQATYSDRRDSIRSSRRISFRSDCSSGSQEGSSSPSNSLDTSDSLNKEHEETHKDVTQEKPKSKEKDKAKKHSHSKLRRFSSMPHLLRGSSKKDNSQKVEDIADKRHPSNARTVSVSSTGMDDVIDSSWEIVEEEMDYSCNATYLCSTVINPPLRPKHLRECVKQYQKQQTKSLKKFGMAKSSNEVVLNLTLEGVKMTNATERGGQGMFFPIDSVSHVMAHPENAEYFAFSTIVTGDSKHKCHLFEQTKIPPTELIERFQAFM